MKFDWDPKKAASNLKKHGVSFEEASEAFSDHLRLESFRPRNGEDRFVMIAATKANLLVVVYAEDDKGVIRIISARRAEPHEKKSYRRHRRR